MFHGIDPAHVWHNPECARGHPATHEHEELKSAILRRAEMRKKLLWRIEIGSNYLLVVLFRTAGNIAGLLPINQIKVVKCKILNEPGINSVQQSHNTLTENQLKYCHNGINRDHTYLVIGSG